MRARRRATLLGVLLVSACATAAWAECITPTSPCETLRGVPLAFYGEVLQVEP